MRRLRLPRPSARQLSASLTILGVLTGLACLVVPVDAAFADDPLLRLHPFSSALEQAVTDVDCGVPVSNLGRRSEGFGLYALARDDACREAATLRAATAVAATAVIALLGLLALSGARARQVAA